MTLGQIVNSDAGLTLVGGALGMLWTFFKSRDWYRQSRARRYGRALQAVESAVDETYRGYVRDIKRSRNDGKLTDDEIRRARRRARERATAIARRQGVNLLHEIGEDYLEYWISKTVGRQKRPR